jgi:hypothetical protein
MCKADKADLDYNDECVYCYIAYVHSLMQMKQFEKCSL